MSKFPSHIQWLLDNRENLLKDALRKADVDLLPEQAVAIMQDADPSAKKVCVQWILDCFLSKGYRWEDVEAGKSSKVNQTLKLFAQHRSSLQKNQRNLAAYKSLSQVYRSIEGYLEEEDNFYGSGRAIKRLEKEEALEESLVLLKTDNMIVAVPRTQKASQWWGKGTQWCTASTQANNYFDQYNSQAPLIVIVFPNGLDPGKEKGKARKFQLWVTKNTLQSERYEISFMDETDEEVSKELIETYWDSFSSILEWAVETNADAAQWFPTKELFRIKYATLEKAIVKQTINFQDIPQEIWSVDLIKAAISVDTDNLAHLGKEWFDRDLCSFALGNDLKSILYFPQELITSSMLSSLLKAKDTWSFEPGYFIIEQARAGMITNEMLWDALRENKGVLGNIPIEIMDKEMILYAITQKEGLGLCTIPRNLRSKEIIEAAVEQDMGNIDYLFDHEWTDGVVDCVLDSDRMPGVLDSIPPDYKNKQEFWEICVQRDRSGKVLDKVPGKFKTMKLCELAVESNAQAVRYVPKKFLTSDLLLSMVSKDGQNLAWIQPEDQTEEICKLAYQSDVFATMHMDEKFTDKTMWVKFLEAYPSFLYRVPYKWLDKTMCLQAADLDEKVIEDIPSEWMSAELYMKMIGAGGRLDSVPPAFQTRELIKEAVRISPFVIKYDFRDDGELCSIAFEKNPDVIRYIAPKFITAGMIEKAVQASPSNIQYASHAGLDHMDLIAIIERNQDCFYNLPSKLCIREIIVPLIQKDTGLLNKGNREAKNVWWRYLEETQETENTKSRESESHSWTTLDLLPLQEKLKSKALVDSHQNTSTVNRLI